MTYLESKINLKLEEIKQKNRYRFLKNPNGIDLSSNDYLGLSNHPELIEAFRVGLEKYGCGSTSSRLIRGHRDVFTSLETYFSDWVKSGDSLFLANGFMANLGLMDLLGDSDTIFYLDRLCHASILDGVRLSGAETRYYKHLDFNHLESLLLKNPTSKHPIVVTESIFSMDGDIVPLPELLSLKNKFGFTLILDEAHSIGLYGKNGSGITNSYIENYSDFIDFRIFTAGKSLGMEGSIISCDKKIKEYLINSLRTFIFSTAPLPAIAYALHKSIDLVRDMDPVRDEINKNSSYFRNTLTQLKFNIGNSSSHIVPVIQGNDKYTMYLAEILQTNGYDVRGIRPPTVKKSRLRINVNAGISETTLNQVINILLTFSSTKSGNKLSEN